MLRLLSVFTFIICASSPVTALACNKINNLPTTINDPGQYCLKKDFNTSLMSGAAIDVQSNDVTIDLQGFAIDNRAAGPGTTAAGISAINQDNTTVRNGTLMGFRSAVNITPGSTGGTESNTVEYVRVIDNIIHGIQAWGPGAVVRHNTVLNTVNPGGLARGIEATGGGSVTITGNVVDHTVGTDEAQGILTLSTTAIVRDNHVTNTRTSSSVAGHGIETGTAVLRGNVVANDGVVGGDVGILVRPSSSAICQGNLVDGFPTPTMNCTDAGDNHPPIPGP